MITATEIIAAFLSLHPHSPANNCIVSRREVIEEALNTSQTTYPQMPIEMFATIGYMETHMGCYGNGNWGAPISARQRHIAGPPARAAAILWHSFEVCGNWEAAARRFRTGLCGHTTIGDRYSRTAMQIANSIRMEVNRQKANNSR